MKSSAWFLLHGPINMVHYVVVEALSYCELNHLTAIGFLNILDCSIYLIAQYI